MQLHRRKALFKFQGNLKHAERHDTTDLELLYENIHAAREDRGRLTIQSRHRMVSGRTSLFKKGVAQNAVQLLVRVYFAETEARNGRR
jgi:hypothetical protein